MLGMMRGERVRVRGSSAASVQEIRDNGVRTHPDIYGLAARDGRGVTVLVWNYHDDDLPAADAAVSVTIDGMVAGRPTLTHYRIDAEHSNAYEAWKKMGSPQEPTRSQYADLEKAGKLQVLGRPERLTVKDGRLDVSVALPRQAVSLLKIDY
jgi:xylan 1,4-beta-xylosidase